MTLGHPGRPVESALELDTSLPFGSCVALSRLLSLSGPASSSVSGLSGSAGGSLVVLLERR